MGSSRQSVICSPNPNSILIYFRGIENQTHQHSVKTLLEYGIQPDILVCRTEHHLDSDLRKKIALFCNVEQKCVIESIDAKTIYEVPSSHERRKLDEVVCEKLSLLGKDIMNSKMESIFKSFI